MLTLAPHTPQVSVDIFLMPHAYSDVATLSDLCQLTAGDLYFYPGFLESIDGDQLYNDLRWNIVRPQVSSLAPSLAVAVPLLARSIGKVKNSQMLIPGMLLGQAKNQFVGNGGAFLRRQMFVEGDTLKRARGDEQ